MRKSISLILAIVMIAMVFATIPFSVFAADETTTPAVSADAAVEITVEGAEPVYVAAADVAAKFKLAESDENVTWTAAKTGKPFTVKLLKDIVVTESFWIFPGENTVFDGNGFTMTAAPADQWTADNRIFGIRGYVVENDEITIKNLKIDNSEAAGGKSCNIMQPYSCPTVNLGEGNYWVAREKGVWFTNTGTTFNITGGYYEAGAEAFYTHTDDKVGTVNISGGTFVTRNTAGNVVNTRNLALNITGGTFMGNVAATGATTLTAGTVVGNVSVPTDATIAETFKVYESAAATIGDTIYATLDEALAAAANATGDVTIKLLADGEITKLVELKGAGNVTIDGDLGNGVRAKVEGKTNSNTFRTYTPNTTLTLKNIDLTANCTGGCLFQIGYKGEAGLTIENCSVKADVKWYLINTMTGDGDGTGLGTTNNINIINSTLESNGGNALYSPGNAGTHKQNVVINITGSTLTGTKTILQINKNCTAQITVKESSLTSTGGDIMTIGEPVDLAAGQTITTTSVNVDSISTLTPAMGKVAVSYNAENTNISVNIESELPETVIAQILDANGAVKATLTDIANLATFFASAVDGDTIKLYQDINAGAVAAKIYGTVTLDGNGKTWTYTGTDYAIWGYNSDPATEANGYVVPEGEMDTLKVINLKLIGVSATEGKTAGGFKFYNSILELGEGNDMNCTNNVVLSARTSGAFIVTGGTYYREGYIFSIGTDKAADKPTTIPVTISGGTFTSTAGVLSLGGSAVNPEATVYTISGGTFLSTKTEGDGKTISVNNAILNITGGVFTQNSPLGYVLAIRGNKATVTVDGAAVEMYGNVLFEAPTNTLNLTTGKLDGKMVPKSDSITPNVVKADGFTLIDTAALPEAYYKEGNGEIESLTFMEAMDKAAIAVWDATITLNKNVTLTKGIKFTVSEVKITINGQGNTITLADGIGNCFIIDSNSNKTELAMENVKITGNPRGANNASSCVFQLKAPDSKLTLKDFTATDVSVRYHFINTMGRDGSAKYVTFDNVTTKNITGDPGSSNKTLIQTGNRYNTANVAPGSGDHSNYTVITIKNSNLEHERRIIECSEASTANVLIENSTLTILTAGDQSAIRLYPVMNIWGEDVMPQSIRVVTRNVTYNVPEGAATIKWDAADNIIVIDGETPDDIVAKIITDDGIEIEIKRSEFAAAFQNGGANNYTTTALKGKNMTIQILRDIALTKDAAGELGFTLTDGQTIVIDGDPYNTGFPAVITAVGGRDGNNPGFRVHGGAGTITFKNLEYNNTNSIMQVYTTNGTVNVENCNWSSPARGFAVNGGKDSTININAGTTITTSGQAFFTDWGWTNCAVNVAEGAVVKGKLIVSKHTNSANIILTVDGGTLIGDITADMGTYLFKTGKMEGNFIVPADEDGVKFFFGDGVVYEGFEFTGTNDLGFKPVPEDSDPIVTDPIVTDPIVTDPIVTDPVVTDPAGTDPVVTDPAGTDPVVTDPAGTDPVVTDPAGTDPVVTDPAGTDPVVTDPAGTEPTGTTPAADAGCAGCGGFTVVATFLALICGAGAAIVIKKK